MLRPLFILFLFFKMSLCFSDIGKWILPLSGDNCKFQLAKSLFKDSKLIIVLHCDVVEPTNITVSHVWSPTSCSPDYFHYFEQRVIDCSRRTLRSAPGESNGTLLQGGNKVYTCHGKESHIIQDDKATVSDSAAKQTIVSQSKVPPLAVVEKEGVYELVMSVWSETKFNLTVSVEMVAPSGYLSAAMWPLLPFFGVMCGVYSCACGGWLLVCALQWRDLLRIQYWIGAVALLGMLESAVYYAVYAAINRTGFFNIEAYMFAEWLSVAKRALARMLVIIVSLGFGIVKPRLGPALQRVVGAGLLWGALAAADAWLRLRRRAGARALLLSEAPLSLLDSALCWWVFVALAHTTRTLQLRRNTIKLSLYRHFTNTLIFAVISSVVFMLYSIKSYRVLSCITGDILSQWNKYLNTMYQGRLHRYLTLINLPITSDTRISVFRFKPICQPVKLPSADWKEVWMDEAYWHILFASVLTVIMVLWRPTNNNQRYAFTPLLDNAEDDDEEEEQFVNDAYGVKMRGTSINADSLSDARESGQPDPSSNSLDSDLRWVEENIPTSTLPLLDSDEEIINTKFEVSKMQ